jgi:hypothetical protein
MPNFDGTGPLKRGRIIGRKKGTCRNCIDEIPCNDEEKNKPVKDEEPDT